jgi:hypothetical protein
MINYWVLTLVHSQLGHVTFQLASEREFWPVATNCSIVHEQKMRMPAEKQKGYFSGLKEKSNSQRIFFSNCMINWPVVEDGQFWPRWRQQVIRNVFVLLLQDFPAFENTPRGETNADNSALSHSRGLLRRECISYVTCHSCIEKKNTKNDTRRICTIKRKAMK